MADKDNTDILIGSETISAEAIGLEKYRIPPKKLKQYLIIGGIALIILILIIIIIVLATRDDKEDKDDKENKGNNDHDSDDDDDDDDEPDVGNPLGEIIAEYEIHSQGNPTVILSSDFVKKSKFSIYVDKEHVKYTKEYTFKGKDWQKNVTYKIYEEIDMDSMFKGVKDLSNIYNFNSKFKNQIYGKYF